MEQASTGFVSPRPVGLLMIRLRPRAVGRRARACVVSMSPATHIFFCFRITIKSLPYPMTPHTHRHFIYVYCMAVPSSQLCVQGVPVPLPRLVLGPAARRHTVNLECSPCTDWATAPPRVVVPAPHDRPVRSVMDGNPKHNHHTHTNKKRKGDKQRIDWSRKSSDKIPR